MKEPHKSKLTDKERHKRFLENAKKAEASDKAKDFDDAFKKVVKLHEKAS